MWERSSKIWGWRKLCSSCRVIGERRFKKPVCAKTGGECAKEATLAPIPDLPITRRAANALRLFVEANTQWRPSFGGLIGLDYPACRLVADSLHIDWDETFPLLRALEGARLRFMQEEEDKRAAEAEADAERKKRGR